MNGKTETSQVTESVSYDNKSNGFDLEGNGLIESCIASLNNGHGINVNTNCRVVGNKIHENDKDGIRVASSGNYLQGNQSTDNDNTGIAVVGISNLIVENTAAGNVTNFRFVTGNTFGPIVDVTNVGDISSVPNADHPWANFEY